MLLAQLITIALLYYQVTMPAVENSKYQSTQVDGKIYIMNTQNGKVEKICDAELNCKVGEK